MTTKNDLLKLGIVANAAFSLLTGLVLAIAPGTVGGWLGVDVDLWLRLFGIALIAHFVILVAVLKMGIPQKLAKFNLLIVAPYPLLIAAFVVTGLIERNLGRGLVLIDGAFIGLCALAQFAGLRNMRQRRQSVPA